MPKFILNNEQLPPIGLGTCFATGEEMYNAVQFAIEHGYRHLDLSPRYGNQKEIGLAIKKLLTEKKFIKNRSELILTSKLYHTCHRENLVEKQLNDILAELQTDYLDYFLMHAPWAFVPKEEDVVDCAPKEDKFGAILDDSINYVDTWKFMLKHCTLNKVRYLGVSNFSAKMIDELYQETGVYPKVNQVECHLLLQQDNLLEYCQAKNIQLIAYAPTGENKITDSSFENSPSLRNHPEVTKIADKLGMNCTATQVLLRFHYERGIVTIPKSVTEKHILENFESQSEKFCLGYEEFAKLRSLNQNKRFFGFNWIGKVKPEMYPFHDGTF